MKASKAACVSRTAESHTGGDRIMDGEAEKTAVDGDGASEEEVEAGGGAVCTAAGALHTLFPLRKLQLVVLRRRRRRRRRSVW